MPETKRFQDLVQNRMSQDPAFARALLREAIDATLAGDGDSGFAILDNYIQATQDELAQQEPATGNMTQRIDRAAHWRTLDQTIAKAQSNFADIPADALVALLNKALTETRRIADPKAEQEPSSGLI